MRIEVATKFDFSDPRGDAVLKRAKELEIGLDFVRVIDVYTIEEELKEEEKEKVASELFSDKVISFYSIDKPVIFEGFSYAIHVKFRPGVKDNVGDISKEAIEELLSKKIKGGVYYSKIYLLFGKISKKDAEKIAKELVNELIQTYEIKSCEEFGEGFAASAPKVPEFEGGKIEYIDLNVADRKLLEISKSRLLALNLEEMKAIKKYFEDEKVREERKKFGLLPMPTDVELEAISQTWSEHCKHKIFNAKIVYKGKKLKINSLFKTYIKGATEKIKKKWLLSVFSDNAGIIEFIPGWNVAMKVETHNSPSALDPYGGALTGILGVNRDILGCGLGAKPIFNTDVFCFAPPDYKGEIPPKLFHPKRVFEGVRAGVADGGNASGIPTVNGAIYFDKRYLGKPLVYCGTGGIMPSKIGDKNTHEKKVMPHDRIFMAGGRIGKDGIHGATFSSIELNEQSPTSAVQLGDPYVQKKLMDFLLEARDKGLFNSVTDNGAGGLSSSVGEMAKSCGGCIIYLDKTPLKYPGLDPWEILLSESQERMTFAVPPTKAIEFVKLAKLREVEVYDIGEFTSSGYFHVMYGAKTVAYLKMEFFHNGLPQMQLIAEKKKQKLKEPKITNINLAEDLLALLSSPNIASKEYVIRQYDHEVQGGSVIKPLCGKKADGPSDGAVIAPIFGRKEGLVISNGICPRYSDIDSYQMAANAVDEAVRNYIACGGMLEHLALLDNFCWSDPIHSKENPDGKYKLAQLVDACRGIYDAAIAYQTPFISGKDSMKNDYKFGKIKISIPPTLLISCIGKIEDVSLAVSSYFKSEGDLVYIVGKTKNELGGSEYYALKGQIGANVPKVNFKENRKTYQKLQNAIRKRLISSCHDCSDGGLAVAIAECCIGGRSGAEIELDGAIGKLLPYQFLFSESAGRFVVSVNPKKEKEFLKAMKGVSVNKIGKVKGNKLSFFLKKQNLFSLEVEELAAAFKKTFNW